MAEENRPSICSFLFQNHFLYPNFEMFFNYLPLTNGQMGGSEAQKFRPFMYAQVLRKCRALVGIDLVLVFQPCECAAGPVCYGVLS